MNDDINDGIDVDQGHASRYAAFMRGSTHPMLREFAGLCGFELDDFQIRSCQEIEDGRGVLVAAPTGSGKTIVGEFAIHLALEDRTQGVLHHADQGPVQPEVPRPREALRRRPGRPAHRRQRDQR